ncbi:MAG: serine--tRNA ligase, partial [Muribaculaceae bacterium]|nr:serine--tRNA ligase [Muribaculaceae bacterium]
MLTLQQIKENPDRIIERLAVKCFDGKEAIERVISVDNRRRELQLSNDNLAAQLNKLAASIGAMMKQGKKDEANAVKAEVAALKEQQKAIAADLAAAESEIRDILLTVPNVPYEGVPAGTSAADNVVEATGGPMPE